LRGWRGGGGGERGKAHEQKNQKEGKKERKTNDGANERLLELRKTRKRARNFFHSPRDAASLVDLEHRQERNDGPDGPALDDGVDVVLCCFSGEGRENERERKRA